jgi:glutaredoxin 3
MLSSLGVDFQEIRLDGRPELRRELSAANGGWSTVPMIFVGERFIGGFDDLRRLDRTGELQEAFGQDAGAAEG